MTRLVHAGSAVVDYVYRLDALPSPGTEKTATSHARIAGGGFNLMVAGRRTGMEVAFAGRLGSGPDGDFLRAALAAENIDMLLPPADSLDSGNSIVLVTDDAERTFVSWPGAESVLGATDLVPVVLRPDDWVFTSGYTLSYPGSREALASWIETLPNGIPFVFDPTPVVLEIPQPILGRVLAQTTWLSCNATEAAAIAGTDEIAANAALLMDRHCPKAAGVVIRNGKAGALIRLRDGSSATVPGFSVNAIDTNGAGDTHIGAFVSALSRGEEPSTAVRYANAAAAISVTRPGGSSAPTHAEILAFIASREDTATSLMTA
ncbi:PfkB family carbohydrate kinase [Mesorhizobium sp. YM1C-6-2]|uniref:PfkB family carbohydrate kinase n=1 Tax=Mesorhizobium sp. YM1C-6-2 TaxID=1827501 RepID=UPI000EF1F02E|nr:PfkB family carbohydrate kinase [Mesorhizobium sp. YM1C-6-2]RLP22398.1 ribokinase [Mesorhizobium sp. YM1C-6-2]